MLVGTLLFLEVSRREYELIFLLYNDHKDQRKLRDAALTALETLFLGK